MGLIKRLKGFKGQASKLSPVLGEDSFLREATNVMADPSGALIKRRGTSANGSDAGLGDGAVFYDEAQEVLFIGDDLYKRNGTGLTLVDNGKTGATEVSTTQAWGVGSLAQPSDTAELNGNLYIAKEGDCLKRYDGVTCSNAGMHPWIAIGKKFVTPPGSGTGAGISHAVDTLVRVSFVDASGNIIVSKDKFTTPLQLAGSETPAVGEDLEIYLDPDYFFHGSSSWVSKYATKDVSFDITGDFSLSAEPGYLDLPLTVDSHNFVVGDYTFVNLTAPGQLGEDALDFIQALEVVAQTATTLDLRVYQPTPYSTTVTLSSNYKKNAISNKNLGSGDVAFTVTGDGVGTPYTFQITSGTWILANYTVGEVITIDGFSGESLTITTVDSINERLSVTGTSTPLAADTGVTGLAEDIFGIIVTDKSSIISNSYVDLFMTNTAGVYHNTKTLMVFIDNSATLGPNKNVSTSDPIVVFFDDVLNPLTFSSPALFQEISITLPPVCKLVEAHQGLLVCGNGSPYFSQRADQLDTPVVNRLSDDAHTMYWSESAGLSSIREMFRGEVNSLYVGVPEDGELTALVSHNGVLLAFKERAIYQVSGVLDIVTVRSDKLFGSGVGCVSHASVQEIGTSIFFLSNKGVYAVRGGSLPEEVTTFIDDVFLDTGLQLNLATSSHDVIRNQYILHIPHTTPADAVTLVHDYEFGGWYVWKELDAAGGIAYDYSDDEIYFVQADGSVKAMKDARNDESVAITARVKTQHEDLNEPSLFKKFLNFKLFNLGGGGHVSTVKTYGDFSTTADTTTTVTTSATVPFEKAKFDSGKNKAHTMQIELENAIVDEDMRIDAIEIEVEQSGRKMKQ